MPRKVLSKSPHILEGIKAMAEFFGKHPTTIAKWIDTGYLPASKTPDGVWFISKSLINMWMFAGNRAELKRKIESGEHRVDPEIVKELLEDGRNKKWND
jgi:hypothetical protein